MNEEIMKNYSIRLGSEEVRRLENLSKIHYYWKRSGIIRGILLAILYVLDDNQIYNLIRFGYGAKNVEVTINVKIS